MELDGSPERRRARSEGSAAPRMKLVSRAQDLLRELGVFHMPLRLMAASDVLATLMRAAKHQVRPPLASGHCRHGHHDGADR